MSVLKSNAVQIGQSATPTENFTLTTGVDGTITLARGNVGATTEDVLTINANGVVQMPSGGNGGDYIKLSDTKTANTAGGTFTSGAWQTRDLNTEDNDDGAHCTLSANQFTLVAGTYRIKAEAPAYDVSVSKSKLYNISDASDEIIGSTDYAPGGSFARNSISGEFTITSAKIFEIQHRCGNTVATNGFGFPSNVGVSEIYTTVELWKVK